MSLTAVFQQHAHLQQYVQLYVLLGMSASCWWYIYTYTRQSWSPSFLHGSAGTVFSPSCGSASLVEDLSSALLSAVLL